jgi:diadenosine tetraphosphate (Ap4A) HIT family hydrolase
MQPDACAFCRPRPASAILFETTTLLVMPDEFPLLPGHTLIIPKEHLRCYADGSPALWHELDEATTRVRHFLEDTYGAPINAVENGVTGQTVFHAHLHLIPGGLSTLPVGVADYEDVVAVDGWHDVGAHFVRRGEYYYVALGLERYVMESSACSSAMLLRARYAAAVGLTLDGQRLLHRATTEDIAELRRRWRAWADTQG